MEKQVTKCGDNKVVAIKDESKKARILVIEAEENVRTLLAMIVTNFGHEVETASNGTQGLALFEPGGFDLVFTDLGMPDMTGWQLAERFKSIDNKVPIALISGWDINFEELEIKEHKVDLFLQKPFEIEGVLGLVQEGIILRERFKTT